MAEIRIYLQVSAIVIDILLITLISAQRPSFAGSRPLNGLNQKDKYYPTTLPNNNIENRFGSGNAPTIPNKIPYGEPQKIPIGYPIVFPESVYTALTTKKPSSNIDGSTSIAFSNRFGDTGDDKMVSPIPSTTQRVRMPLDALGDHLLIAQLNRIPVDKRPFWFINYQAIEEQRNNTATNFAGVKSSKGFFSG